MPAYRNPICVLHDCCWSSSADFACRHPYADKYDLLMDIVTEEFSHLEIVGATIQMLLSGVNGALKLASETDERRITHRFLKQGS